MTESKPAQTFVLVPGAWLGGRVAKVIYVGAVVPELGKSMVDENEQYGEIIRQAITVSPDTTVPAGLDEVQSRIDLRVSEPVELPMRYVGHWSKAWGVESVEGSRDRP